MTMMAKTRVHLTSHRQIPVIAVLILLTLRHDRAHSLPLPPPFQQPSSPFSLKVAECNRDAECCASLFSPAGRPHLVVNAAATAPGRRTYAWQMAVHPSSDIVSGSVARTGEWDAEKTREMLGALAAGGRLLDIGANIGWFSLAVAYAGHRVVAVEPGEENLVMLRHSLCLAPKEVRARVEIVPTGLGAVDGMRCEMWTSKDANRGNMFTVCDSRKKSASVVRMRERDYRKLGEVTLSRFDSLVSSGVVQFSKGERVAVKIDVEGFEPLALAGAEEFLRHVRPTRIYAEYCPNMLARAARSVEATEGEAERTPERFLDEMRRRGYAAEVTPTGIDMVWGEFFEVEFRREGDA